jgi:hypothetical protein
VLVPAADRLGVVRVKGVERLGKPERVFATVRRTGWQPRWLDRLPRAAAGG